MNLTHIVGARPNFMKVAPVMAAIGRVPRFKQTLVHTGQHYDTNMSDIFFQQLGMPQPDVNLEVGSGTHSVQTAQIMMKFEEALPKLKPELVLVYGDVNSTVAATLVCAKHNIRVAHVEAGLRSFDRSMPEEINRLVTDQLADLLFTPSRDGNENLLREGVDSSKIHLVGNVMIDTLIRLLPKVQVPGWAAGASIPPFALVTLHRPSNVDDAPMLMAIMQQLRDIGSKLPVIFPIHPRTRQRLQTSGIEVQSSGGLALASSAFQPPACGLHLVEPLGYLEFLGLQQKAALVITDSGGIQEESTYLGVPCLTLRDNTERPVTVEMGTNVLLGRDLSRLKSEVERIIRGASKRGRTPPLWDGKAADRIANVLAKL
jgi:UDP-N-acetylglucosamine 2-epimerase (non-hydrolysing)